MVRRRTSLASKSLAEPELHETMADHIVPHFHNDPGVAVIEIGAREFMCVGARPPFDPTLAYPKTKEEEQAWLKAPIGHKRS